MNDTSTRSAQRKLQDNIRRVRERMAEACTRVRREPESVRLIAVTKSVEVDVIRMALDQGLLDLAENRVQHLCKRAAMVQETLKRRRILDGGRSPVIPIWHMVGRLQRNKVRSVLQWSNVIHSVDSLRLGEEINAEAEARGVVTDVFLQVNLSGEKGKSGVAVGAAEIIAQQVHSMPNVRLIGLMTMAPLVDDLERVRSDFRRLREIAEDVSEQGWFEDDRCELSMGMSNDFEVAIEEGATMIRIGSALFQGVARDADQYGGAGSPRA